jgi:hypothetical protein
MKQQTHAPKPRTTRTSIKAMQPLFTPNVCDIEMFTQQFFDDSSASWLENKTKCANGQYKYSCSHIYPKSGKRCGRAMEHVHT